MHASHRVIIIVLVVLLGLPGVTLRAQPERLRIIASNSILADVVANVAGDAAEVSSLMPIFADPHTYTPTPQDLVALSRADAIFVVGADFEENLGVALENVGSDMTIITASLCVNILPFGETGDLSDDEHAHAEAATSSIAARCAAHHAELENLMDHTGAMTDHHDQEHAATLGMLYTLSCGGHEEAGTAEDDHAHETGSCDPHVWTDPHNGMLWALMARDALSELDPANADVYAANAAAYVNALQALIEHDLEPMLASIPPENRRLVTNHQAFNYYASAFDLELVGTVLPGASTLAEPSAADLARLIEAIREVNVPAIFAETTANPTLAEQVARETGVEFYTLYTGSLSEPNGPASTYIDYLRHNTRVIAEALSAPEGCPPCTMHVP